VNLLCQRLSVRDFDRQVAEIQIRAAILNEQFGYLGYWHWMRAATLRVPLVVRSPE
jgi:hypothetical protein